MSTAVPVSVVIPTIGRTSHLRSCLESLAESSRYPSEVLVVDQSPGTEIANLVSSFDRLGARRIACRERGISLGTNMGLREASHEIVLVTHDDCTVASSWVETASKLMSADSDRIITGRVLPAGDPRAVPVTRLETNAIDYTGTPYYGGLRPMNMALNRSTMLAFGGFDERFDSSSEDNDLCYRWLLAGRRLQYEPRLVVWHHDVRSPKELERVYVTYWRGQGRFYAKHLWQGDARMLRYIARDLLWDGSHAMAERVLRGRPRWTDWRRGVLRGLAVGLLEGAWIFRPRRAGSRRS